ncbi:MAG: glycosyltransferase [Rhodothermales bacterium]
MSRAFRQLCYLAGFRFFHGTLIQTTTLPTERVDMTGEKRLRIVLVGPASPFRGGIAQFTDGMAEGLARRGHGVEIVTFSRQYPEIFFPGISQMEPGAQPGRALALVDSLNPISWLTTARRIAAMKPHVVIFQYWLPFFAPPFGTIAGRLRKHDVKILSILHNVLPHERNPGDRVLAKYFLKRCDRLVALSNSVARDLRSLGIDRPLRTTPHPVYAHFGDPIPKEIARRQLGMPEEGEILLFFGFVRRYKGLHILLQAMSEVIRHRPGVRLVVAGEFYEDEDTYREAIRSLGLSDHVVLYPEYIEARRVGELFSAADIVVQPYEAATQSGVVQTAYHFEKPVIVTNVGGLAEVVIHEESGLVVPPKDPGALAAAIIRFFEGSLAEHLSEGARREKARHSWDHFVDVVEEEIA